MKPPSFIALRIPPVAPPLLLDAAAAPGLAAAAAIDPLHAADRRGAAMLRRARARCSRRA